jgi:hypothetical protein
MTQVPESVHRSESIQPTERLRCFAWQARLNRCQFRERLTVFNNRNFLVGLPRFIAKSFFNGNHMWRRAKRTRNSLVNRNRKAAPGEPFHHSVYVILLDSAVVQHPSILHLNPSRDPGKPCVYVGMTGLAVQDRFQNHKKGNKSACTKHSHRNCSNRDA